MCKHQEDNENDKRKQKEMSCNAYIRIAFMVVISIVCMCFLIRINRDFNNEQRVITSCCEKNLKSVTSKTDSIVTITINEQKLPNGKIEKQNIVVVNNEEILKQIKIESNNIVSTLKLQTEKIQSEFTILSLWTGILMVVFLIYSFFSLFKADDISREARSASREVNKILSDVTLTNTEILQKKVEIDTKWVEIKETIESKINEVIGNNKDRFEDNVKESSDKINNIYVKVHKEIQAEKESYATAMKQKMDVLDEYTSFIGELKKLVLDNTEVDGANMPSTATVEPVMGTSAIDNSEENNKPADE